MQYSLGETNQKCKEIIFQAPQIRSALLELYESCDYAMTKGNVEN